MRAEEQRASLTGWAAGLVALALLSGCASNKEKVVRKTFPPPPPDIVNLTDIRSYAKDLKHDGVVNKRLVRYLIGQGYYTLALQHTGKLLKEDRQDAEVYFLKGYILREIGRYEGAVKELKKASELRADYAEAWNALGMTYDLMRKRKEAESAYLEALRINPSSPKYLNNLGFSYFSTGRYDRAAELYEKALAYDPTNVKIHNNLGFAYGMLGRYPEAVGEFRQAGRNEVVYNNVGFLYYMLGYNNEAKVMYARALESNPQFAKARYNLRLIEKEAGGHPAGP